MAVSVVKVFFCSLMLAVIVWFALDLSMANDVRIHEVIYWAGVGAGFVLGGYLAGFISWGWLAGGMAGLFAGFYLPLALMFVFPYTGYEEILPWLLLSAGSGGLLGGYSLNKHFKSRFSH